MSGLSYLHLAIHAATCEKCQPLKSEFYSSMTRKLLQSQVLVEGLAVWLAPKEVNQRLHLILAATLLENSMSVSSALSMIHWILLEDGIEHICAVYL